MSTILLDQFDALVDMPEAVERLRRLVLDLAVRGRLVPQDPDDEPASVLLERIAAQKQRLFKAGEIQKPKRYKPLAKTDEPYSLPTGWAWTRLGVVRHGCGQTTPEARFSYIDVSAIDKERGVIGDSVDVVEAGDAASRARKLVRQGTVLYSTVRPTLLNVAIVDREFDPPPIASTAFAIVHPFGGVDSRYLYFYLRSQPMIDFVESKMVGLAYPAISDAKLYPAPLPLPPEAEQRRIVARVDELMALCDRLADGLARRDGLRQRWAVSTVRHVSEDEPIRGAPAWAFAEAHLDALLATPEAVPLVRRLVLDLAVRGQLTEQDSSDEPASGLLQRITAEKQRRYEAGEIRKPKPLAPVAEDERTFETPEGWAWTRLGALGDWGAGATPSRSRSSYYKRGTIPWLKTGELNDGVISSAVEFVTDLAYEETSLRLNPPGSVLIAMYGATIGKLGILDFEATTNQACCACTLFCDLPSWYLFYVLRSKREHFRSLGAGGAQPNISKAKLVAEPIALPPEAEQHRIVARVDELMALCDRMEGGLREGQEGAARLLEAALTRTLA